MGGSFPKKNRGAYEKKVNSPILAHEPAQRPLMLPQADARSVIAKSRLFLHHCRDNGWIAR
jgi:hypothetical protein